MFAKDLEGRLLPLTEAEDVMEEAEIDSRALAEIEEEVEIEEEEAEIEEGVGLPGLTSFDACIE